MALPTSVTLTLPTKNTDGTALSIESIADVQVGFGTASGNYTLIADDKVFNTQVGVGGVVTIPFASLNENLGFGTWFAAARVVSTAGKPSDWSNEASFSIEAPIPNPPTGFTVA